LKTGRILLYAGVGAVILAGAFFAHHYYGRLKHSLLGQERQAFQADDLYNTANKLFKRGRRDKNEVCLTIDDGPHAKSLPRLLKILKQYNVKATFFMVGRRIQERPDLVREVLKEGHEVGNHTQNHPRLDTLAPDQMRIELAMCEHSFEQATGGTKMKLFRPPGMRFTPELWQVVSEFGYTTVDWNYGAKDFTIVTNGPTMAGGENHIAEYVLKNVTPGGIIVLHDNPVTADALPTILEGLKQKGLAIRNVTEMLADLPTPVRVVSNAGKLGKLTAYDVRS
jgi:peptidoglycan/xylan/chitin deacetylase (PgdA/CDA1 family)